MINPQLNRRAFLGAAAALPMLSGTTSVHAQTTAPWPKDAMDFARALRAKEWTAEAAARSAMDRARAANGSLNFMVAEALDAAVARLSGPNAPLGVPTLIKDLEPLQGVPTRFGSRAFDDAAPAKETGPFPNRLQQLGLNPIGKSATSEFGLMPTIASGDPLVAVATPWDPTRSAGGSSGGAAAAVAAGVVPIAHAGDAGGSIRIPASFCGLVGFKPSRGRTLGSGRKASVSSLHVQHVLTRTVRDTALVMAGNEITTATPDYPPVGLLTEPSARRLKIGVLRTSLLGEQPETAVADGLEAVIALLTKLGHTVSEASWPVDGRAFADTFTDLWAVGAKDEVQRLPAAKRAQVQKVTAGLAARGERIGFLEVAGLGQRINDAITRYESAFRTVDVLLSPTVGVLPPPVGWLTGDMAFEEALPKLRTLAGYTPLHNVTGAPAISLPLHWSQALPVGMQFAARAGDDKTLLELAFELERAAPWADRRPPIWVG